MSEPKKQEKSNILVVDDEVGARELCVDFLESDDYVIDTSENGKQAIDFLEKNKVHLVLSDINMPLLNGIDLLREIKKKYPDIEVILMTAYGGLQSAIEALRHGAYDYITKPFTSDILRATVRRCLEKQRLSDELKNAQKELITREKLATLGSLSGWLAHRMRNPLNVILMCTQYLEGKFADNDERREVLKAIEDKVKSLEKMTKDFIEFTRTYQPNLTKYNVHKIFEKVLNSVAYRCKIQKVNIAKELGNDIPELLVDYELIEEVISNIVNNALDVMENTGTLTIKTHKLDNNTVALDIINTGSCVTKDQETNIFEPFFTTKERGTGLGLAIAKRVIDSHKGTVSAVGDPKNNTTTFRITLPIP